MLIIIEGCDATGKTSLARLIRDRLPVLTADMWHNGPLKQHPLDEYESTLSNYVPGAQTDLVIDRFHMGERVYGPLKRGGTPQDDAVNLHINLFLRSRGAYIVVAHASVDAITSRMRTRGEDFITECEVPLILEGFKRELRLAAPYQGFHVGDWETTNLTEQRLSIAAWQLISQAAICEAHVSPLASFPAYIGGPQPNILLLGEARNIDETLQGRVAPFLPFANTSGHYLMQTILPFANDGVQFGVANALENDVQALWETLGNPLIVALGNVAQQVCLDAGLNFDAAAHPQYWRRFHHHDMEGYRKALFGRFL